MSPRFPTARVRPTYEERCWADDRNPGGLTIGDGCQRGGVSALGLCRRHHLEITGRAVAELQVA